MHNPVFLDKFCQFFAKARRKYYYSTLFGSLEPFAKLYCNKLHRMTIFLKKTNTGGVDEEEHTKNP